MVLDAIPEAPVRKRKTNLSKAKQARRSGRTSKFQISPKNASNNQAKRINRNPYSAQNQVPKVAPMNAKHKAKMAREREKMEFVGKPSSYKKIHLRAQKKMKHKMVDRGLMKEYVKAINAVEDTKKKRRKSRKSGDLIYVYICVCVYM